MKKIHLVLLALLLITAITAQCQTPADVFRIQEPSPKPMVTNEYHLAKFNLDFGGGWPSELVSAIEKGTGKHLNAIIPDEFATKKLPPLKMNNVNVVQLFAALKNASRRELRMPSNNPGGNYSIHSTSCGFTTTGPISDDSIWSFSVDEPKKNDEVKICRFYSLAPYLDRGLTVDDITTAIQTGWKMSGLDENSSPKISFHAQTELLIAVGEQSQLLTIDLVLQALPPTARVNRAHTLPK